MRVWTGKKAFFSGAALAVVLLIGGCGGKEPGTMMYRINCGASAETEYVDKTGKAWQNDQVLETGKAWGALGGKIAIREPALIIHDRDAPEIFRTERYNMDGYQFAVPDGSYTVRLHFAETCDINFEPGGRIFNVKVAGRDAVTDFDPYVEGGGFARPAVVECAGVQPSEGKLAITFSGRGAAIYGIEIFQEETPQPAAVRTIAKSPGPKNAHLVPTPADGAEIKKMLFVGNSLTFYWALPESLAAMVNAGQSAVGIEPHRSLSGGKKLEWHWTQGTARRMIEEGDFDWVSLQPGHAEDLPTWAGKFVELIRRKGARAFLFIRWDNREKMTMQDTITSEYVETARKLGLTIVPIGPAWQAALKERPDLVLLNRDTVHQGMHGGYLDACVFYAVLTGQKPPGRARRATLVQQVDIEKDTAAFLERIAWQTVQEYKTKGME